MKKIVIIEKECDNWKFSSNVNKVIRAALNSFFFLKKTFCTQQKHKKHQKHQRKKNATKQKHKNANKWTKIKNAP